MKCAGGSQRTKDYQLRTQRQVIWFLIWENGIQILEWESSH